MTRRYVVSGRVQGVGFRYFVMRKARELGISGGVRNLPTGQVEVTASASMDEAHRQLEESLRTGPRFAHVTSVEVTELMDEADSLNGFEIRD